LDENSKNILTLVDSDGKDKRTLKTKIEEARPALTEAKTNYERLKIEHDKLKKDVTKMPEVYKYPSKGATRLRSIGGGSILKRTRKKKKRN
jgi:hypothetical protein